MSNRTNEQQQAKRKQEDAVINRILIWFGCAVVVEFILLLVNRLTSGIAVIQWLSILVPVATVLALIYFLFQHDFFCACVISAGGILSLQLYRKIYVFHPTMIRCGFGFAFVLLAAAVAVTVLIQKTGKPMPLRVDKLFPRDANFPLLYITCALNAVLLALTLILGGIAAYYLLFVLVGWLFAMAVYYIVKMM